jgi:hypothetical protein
VGGGRIRVSFQVEAPTAQDAEERAGEILKGCSRYVGVEPTAVSSRRGSAVVSYAGAAASTWRTGPYAASSLASMIALADVELRSASKSSASATAAESVTLSTMTSPTATIESSRSTPLPVTQERAR